MFTFLLFICLLFTSEAEAWNIKKAVATSLISFGCFAPLLPALADAIPTVGSAAPEFSLPSNRGKDISLKDYAGKRLVLYTYPGDFTSGCTIEAQAFERDFSKFKDVDVEILGLSVDSPEKHLDFAKSYGLEFPLVSDKGGVISNKYGTLLDIPFMGKFSNRQTYIISPTGKIEYVFTDVEGKVAKHSEEVLAKVKSLSS